MGNPYLVIKPDNCYICYDFDKHKYLGPVVISNGYYFFWFNTNYVRSGDILVSYLNDKNICVPCKFNIKLNAHTEILIVGDFRFILHLNNKLPEGLKVLCYFSRYNILDINLPIGLKYLCLNSIVESQIINKIKLPFGCQIILL